MIIAIIATISIAVAVTITRTRFTVLIHIIVVGAIVAIIVTFVTSCTMNFTIITAGGNATISIPAPTRLLSLSLSVRVPSNAQYLGLLLSSFYKYIGTNQFQDILPPLQKPGLASGVCSCTYVYIYICCIYGS